MTYLSLHSIILNTHYSTWAHGTQEQVLVPVLPLTGTLIRLINTLATIVDTVANSEVLINTGCSPFSLFMLEEGLQMNLYFSTAHGYMSHDLSSMIGWIWNSDCIQYISTLDRQILTWESTHKLKVRLRRKKRSCECLKTMTVCVFIINCKLHGWWNDVTYTVTV